MMWNGWKCNRMSKKQTWDQPTDRQRDRWTDIVPYNDKKLLKRIFFFPRSRQSFREVHTFLNLMSLLVFFDFFLTRTRERFRKAGWPFWPSSSLLVIFHICPNKPPIIPIHGWDDPIGPCLDEVYGARSQVMYPFMYLFRQRQLLFNYSS